MKKFKLTGEKLVNLGLLLVSIFYLSYSLCNYKLGTIRLPKEGFIPMLLGIGMVAISGFLTMQAFLGKGDAQQVKFNISWLRFGCIVAVSFLYALVLVPLGYCIATFLFLFAVTSRRLAVSWPSLRFGIATAMADSRHRRPPQQVCVYA